MPPGPASAAAARPSAPDSVPFSAAPCAALAAHPLLERLQRQARRVLQPCDAGQMAWHVWGQAGAGVPLVLLHGGSGSWTHWARNIEALVASGRQVWAADMPGFGASDAPAGVVDPPLLAELMAQALQALFGPRGCDLVGFSLGGLVAGLLLARQPQRARQLVLVGAPAMGVVPQRPYALRGWRHLPPERQDAVHRYNLAELMLADAALIDADDGLALVLHRANVQRDRLPRRRPATPDALARALPALSCPVHAIYGRSDALYRQWITALPQAFAVAPGFTGLSFIEQAGHWVAFEQPQAFVAVLLKVLGDSQRHPMGSSY